MTDASGAAPSAVPRLPVVLLWHMHQPPYRDALDGQYVLPWTYLHAIKDYTDMAAHLEDNPGARAVVNFSPVLLEQLRDLAVRIEAHLLAGAALPDAVLALLGPAPLPRDPPQRLALLQACLRAHPQTMVQRFPPYQELATLAESFASEERIGYAADGFLHDLAVWYHLAWLGETVRRSEPLAAQLAARARDFSPAERRALLELIGRLVAAIVPRYRALAAAGRCELSMTPYAHPILPLLVDFASAREAVPELPLPRHHRYAGGAERAGWHILEGLRVFTETFGARPAGCWPAEGAVSTETLRLLAHIGQFRWAASGGAVLRASLAREPDPTPAAAEHRAYRLQGTRLDCFFRDDALSDLIGFTYATWHGDDAAHNLTAALAQLAARYAGSGQHAVLIALDGENAWEHYPFNGYYFLRALYAQLAAHPQLEMLTFAQCLERGLAPAPLRQVCAGSWVHGTLGTWMGDAAKNAAWDLLCDAKERFDERLPQLDPSQRAAAQAQLALCEASDWFWWFGDYNPPEAVRQFDRLYRHQLLTLYRHLGVSEPAQLAEPLALGGGQAEHGGVMRRSG